MEKMKQVELKKYKFEKRNVPKIKALSGNSGPSGFHRKVKIQRFLNQVFKLN